VVGALTPKRKLEVARAIAAANLPYLDAALYALVLRETPNMPTATMGVSKDAILYWDPRCVESYTVEELAGALLHEIDHLFRETHKRAEAIGIKPPADGTVIDESVEKVMADFKLFNLAADMSINEQLKKVSENLSTSTASARSGSSAPAGRANPFRVRPDWIYPETHQQKPNLIAEERYQLLKKNPPPPQKGGGGVGSGKCGSCAGNPIPGEPKGGTPGVGRSPADMARVRREVAEAVRSEVAKGRGLVPEGWARWADGELAPAKIPWRQELGRIVRGAVAYKSGATDFGFGRLSRRQGGLGFGVGCAVLPALRAYTPEVMVAVDTSGSMSAAELKSAMSETRGILREVGASVTFCACDAEVHTLKRASTWEEAANGLKGGGGTDFRPIFVAAAKVKPRPSVLIFFTDGCGPAPEAPSPHFTTIFVLLGSGRQKPCTWGKFIEIEDASA